MAARYLFIGLAAGATALAAAFLFARDVLAVDTTGMGPNRITPNLDPNPNANPNPNNNPNPQPPRQPLAAIPNPQPPRVARGTPPRVPLATIPNPPHPPPNNDDNLPPQR